MSELQTAKLSQLQESPNNPRKIFDKKSMDELIASIKERGVVTPLLVRKTKNSHFEIISGGRRYRASQAAGKEDVPVIIREMSDEDALELMVLENDQRVDVHPLEQCTGYQQLQKQENLTLEELATKVGKSVSYVAKRLAYGNLIEPIRKLFYDMKIGPLQALMVARLGPDQQKQTVVWLKDGYSLDNLHREIQRNFFLILKEAPFDTADAELVPKAGSCLACPKRTGFNKALFEDITVDTCTDPGCFDSKCDAFVKKQIAAHKDALRLSVVNSYDNPAKLKGTKVWVKAGDKNCPDTTMGLVVEILGRNPIESQQGVKLGQSLKVCDKPGCKTHAAAKESSNRASLRTDSDRATEKKRKIELRRRGLIFKELAADQFDVLEKDYRSILDWAIRGLSSDHARAICNAMAWEIAPAKYGGKDYTGTIEKNLAKLTAEAVENWLYLIMLAGTDLWFYNNTKVEKPELLEAKAKAAGVPLDTLAKEAKEKPKKVKSEAKKKVEKK